MLQIVPFDESLRRIWKLKFSLKFKSFHSKRIKTMNLFSFFHKICCLVQHEFHSYFRKHSTVAAVNECAKCEWVWLSDNHPMCTFVYVSLSTILTVEFFTHTHSHTIVPLVYGSHPSNGSVAFGRMLEVEWNASAFFFFSFTMNIKSRAAVVFEQR